MGALAVARLTGAAHTRMLAEGRPEEAGMLVSGHRTVQEEGRGTASSTVDAPVSCRVPWPRRRDSARGGVAAAGRHRALKKPASTRRPRTCKDTPAARQASVGLSRFSDGSETS